MPTAPTEHEITSTGNILEWYARACNPSHFEVYVNESLLFTEEWDGLTIEFSVDDLPAGSHRIDVMAYHISGYSMSAFSFVEVNDLTAPTTIVGPTSIIIDSGVAVNAQFSSTDPSGIEWSVNDTVNFAISSAGVLSSGTDLAVGEYALLITATDPFGHSATHVVIVTVNVPPEEGLPSTMILIFGGAGAAVVIVVVIVILKKKGT
jgi:hypothetical protein